MNKFQIRREIATLIDNIKGHFDNTGDNEHVPQLELELILYKVRNLHEKIIVFNYLNTNTEVQEINSIIETTIHLKKEDLLKTEHSEIPADLFGNKTIPPGIKSKTEKKTEKKDDKVLTDKLQSPPISDLKSAIGINDQFQFANELFEGSIQEYNIAIQQLNTAGTLESAIDYFSNLQQLYNWDSENETVRQLVNLVDRRYSA